jgi:3-hydroxyisobutyrate dehydrogenase
MKIGFIGTGVMGSHMVMHLSQHHQLTIFNRRLEKAHRLKSFAQIALTLNEAIIGQDIIMTMLGTPQDVSDVFSQILLDAQPGTIWIDLTTSSPSLASKLSLQAASKGVIALDAPVTGGEKGAKNHTLTIMVGGDLITFEKMKPLLELIGQTILYSGKSGSGQHTKMANQIAIAGTLVSLAESLTYAQQHNLDLQQALQVIQSGAASSYSALHYGAKMIQGDWAATFYLKHFLKDLNIAITESPTPLPIAMQVKKMLETLVDQYGEEGVQAIIKSYNESTLTPVNSVK